MNRKLIKKAKNDFEKYFFKLMNNVVFRKIMEKLIKLRDIKFVTTEKIKKLFGVRTELLYNKIFLWKFISHRNKKISINIRIKQNSNVWLLVKLCETKIWRISKTMLYRYRQLYNLHKNRKHLHRHCKRCLNKIWYYKLWIRQTTTKKGKNKKVKV